MRRSPDSTSNTQDVSDWERRTYRRPTHWKTKGHLSPAVGEQSCRQRRERCSETYAVIEMLAADIGLTSFTSKAFCRASFLLAASSCSSSSFSQSKQRLLHVDALCIAGLFSVWSRKKNSQHLYCYVLLICIQIQHSDSLTQPTLVSSCAFARLSTAMAKKTFRRVSE